MRADIRFLLVTALIGMLHVAPVFAQPQADAVQSVLLHKGKDGFVHAVPLQPGFVITFTAPDTGVMKTLLKVELQPLPTDRLGMGAVRRRTAQGDLVAGVAVDNERLYVLAATRVYGAAPDANPSPKKAKKSKSKPAVDVGSPDVTPPSARGGQAGDQARVVATEPMLIGHQFKLFAFALKDGAPLLGDGYALPLVNEDPMATEPPDTKRVRETLGRGSIKLVKEGVQARGTTILFTGSDVRSVETQGKQFTPPPGFFAREPERVFRG